MFVVVDVGQAEVSVRVGVVERARELGIGRQHARERNVLAPRHGEHFLDLEIVDVQLCRGRILPHQSRVAGRVDRGTREVRCDVVVHDVAAGLRLGSEIAVVGAFVLETSRRSIRVHAGQKELRLLVHLVDSTVDVGVHL